MALMFAVAWVAPAQAQNKSAAKPTGEAPVKPGPGEAPKPKLAPMSAVSTDPAPEQDPGIWYVIVDPDDPTASSAYQAMLKLPTLRSHMIVAGAFAVLMEDIEMRRRLPSAFPELTFLNGRQLELVRFLIQKNPTLSPSRLLEEMRSGK